MIGIVAFGLSLALFVTVMLVLAYEAFRPINETDEWCAAIDLALDEEDRQRRLDETWPA